VAEKLTREGLNNSQICSISKTCALCNGRTNLTGMLLN